MGRRRPGPLAAVVTAAGLLAGCSSDPAFWDNLAYGLDTVAYELGETPVCRWGPDGYGGSVQTCQPAWSVNQPVYITQPDYVHPVYEQRRHDRRYDHDRRDRRDDRHHRPGRGSGHDRGKGHGRR